MEVSQTAARDLALPRLEEVLRRFSPWAFLDIELKVPGLERRTVAFLRQAPPPRGYVVSSFLPEVLTTIRGFDASVPLGFICEKNEELKHWRELPVEWVIPREDLVDEVLFESIHAADKKVMVWTVNNAHNIRLLAKCGVDAIITDETEELGRTL